jgi:hypothetical protein
MTGRLHAAGLSWTHWDMISRLRDADQEGPAGTDK